MWAPRVTLRALRASGDPTRREGGENQTRMPHRSPDRLGIACCLPGIPGKPARCQVNFWLGRAALRSSAGPQSGAGAKPCRPGQGRGRKQAPGPGVLGMRRIGLGVREGRSGRRLGEAKFDLGLGEDSPCYKRSEGKLEAWVCLYPQVSPLGVLSRWCW